MSFKEAFAENNTELQAILETVNGLPDYVKPKKFNLETVLETTSISTGTSAYLQYSTWVTPYNSDGYWLEIVPADGLVTDQSVLIPMKIVALSSSDYQISLCPTGGAFVFIYIKDSKLYYTTSVNNMLSALIKSIRVVK